MQPLRVRKTQHANPAAFGPNHRKTNGYPRRPETYMYQELVEKNMRAIVYGILDGAGL